MSEQASENPQARITNSFLAWIKNAVEVGIPVVVQKGDKEELSAALRNIASAYKFLGLTDGEIMELAKSGESAAKLEKALKKKVDTGQLVQLRKDYENHWSKFRENRQVMSEKYGLSDRQMLALFQEITRLG